MSLTQRGDRTMMSSGNTSPSVHSTPNLFFPALNPDRNQIRPILWQHGNRFIWGFKFSLALGFGGCCWLTSKCPLCPQSSLPSDAVLGAIIPVGLAFQNKGCMFSICSSKEGHIAAGLANTPRLGNQCPIWRLHLWAVPDYYDLVWFRLRWCTVETRQASFTPYAFWISDVASEGGPKTVEEHQEGLMWGHPWCLCKHFHL